MSEKILENKVVAITGGARGIGLAIADKCIDKKTKTVIILDIDEDEGKKAIKTLTDKHGSDKAVFIKCDITKDIDAVASEIKEKYKLIDLFINNAGVAGERDWKRCVDVNLTFLIGWSLKIFEHMRIDRGGKGGTIINVASVIGIGNYSAFPVYQSSKYGVIGFSISMGHQDNFAISGVRLVVLCPGFTETQMSVDVKTWDGYPEDKVDALKTSWVTQKVDVVGEAAVAVFERADSGTLWVIDENKPLFEVILSK